MTPEEALKKAKDALDKAIESKQLSQDFVKSIGPAIVELLRPTLDDLRLSKEDIMDAVSQIKVEAPIVEVPRAQVEVKIPEIRVPTPEVTVNVPPFKIPEVKIPVIKVPKPEVTVNIPEIKVPKPEVTVNVPQTKIQLPNDMEVSLKGITLKKPLPVMVMNPQSGSGARSGLTLSDIVTPSGVSVIDNVNNALKTSLSGSDTNSGPVGSNTLRVTQATDVANSVNIIQINGNTISTDQGISNSGTLRVVNAVDIANSVNLIQLAGTAVSVNTGTSDSGTLRIVTASNSNLSTQTLTDAVTNADANAKMVFNLGFNGSTWDRLISDTDSNDGMTTSSQGILRVMSHPMSFNGTTWDRLRNGSGVSATALRVVNAVDVSNSSKGIGVAMTTNPTAASDGADNFIKTDKIGRQLNTPVQVRQLRSTAYATLNSNNETTLLAGIASTFLDIIEVKCANASTSAVSVDIRDGTGAGIVDTINIPASSTAGVSYAVPLPQNTTANTWTVKFNTDTGSDLSNTKVYVTALFSQET